MAEPLTLPRAGSRPRLPSSLGSGLSFPRASFSAEHVQGVSLGSAVRFLVIGLSGGYRM